MPEKKTGGSRRYHYQPSRGLGRDGCRRSTLSAVTFEQAGAIVAALAKSVHRTPPAAGGHLDA
jgi:hypothetical protein